MKITRPLLLRLILEELNVSDIETLDKKKVLQKLIYLLQAFGFNLLYSFRWDLYGPYSSQLGVEAKEVLRKKKEEYDRIIQEQSFCLSKEAGSKIRAFKRSLGDKAMEDPALGELVASIHFANQMFSRNGRAKEFIEKHKQHLYDRYDEAENLSNQYLSD